MFTNKTILVTGGTGSWGQELTRKLLIEEPKEIRIFSRNEFTQVEMKRKFNSPVLNFLIGDIRDYEAVSDACQNVDYVFHLAALKHVPICEYQPLEALKTNVNGTQNIIRASIEHGVNKVIDVSTDKAVDPINFYGLTKAIGEKLIIKANDLNEKTRFVCIRGGNVLGTNGSVVPLFKQQIIEGKPLTLTDKEMTRFFLTIPEAIELLIKAASAAIGGETFVMKMPACKITDLIEVLKSVFGQSSLPVKEIGMREGEKLHEVLISRTESQTTYQYDKQYFVILPSHPAEQLLSHYSHLNKISFPYFQSDQELMSHEEIKLLLQKGKFI
ncbi:polysaccharide biosynthesis protein [Paenibacillus harenae]|uniref:FlaA1/EpsC-like NDP-sugar epimerase n=1 Tax=Paenibacillus harenae TaxID=306543 RepID=A0ABT9U429_PAEHA|nr:polysaccharide biosynthesis protein [Paenibacillus harenae]MDQ0114395.1 FlaA1/EpsC-like NDP-sugar epimerase [Paenibacillus harenae]